MLRYWVLFVLMTANSMHADVQDPARSLLLKDRPLVIAHRGYSGLAPENTVRAFAKALHASADMVELDYRTSKDGVPMVFHDQTLDRTTDIVARWGREGTRVGDYSARALAALDAGSWFDEVYSGEMIPTLVAALGYIIGEGGVPLVEQKDGEALDLAKILRQRGWMNRVIVQSFDWAFLRELNQQIPEQVLGAIGPPRRDQGRVLSRQERQLNEAWLDRLALPGVRVVVWNHFVDRESIAMAQQRGLKVWIYTVNDARLAGELLDMGVDGIITDEVSVIWRAMALRAMTTE